ncbi:hypothetical protein D2E26_1110 [Bifidobacterium dolichotidis]|uniref:Peptidase n=1 Tax=Bifidobacterium dolichotidis TaxID=2306976 RepID=A0A430FQG2_9BIFI|nr:hypothetical protein [Bifidobacterium dolichotidis]RSX55056.1 hypothetical protein D2E26_1110 [Bifidobacterium dolichotidis]
MNRRQLPPTASITARIAAALGAFALMAAAWIGFTPAQAQAQETEPSHVAATTAVSTPNSMSVTFDYDGHAVSDAHLVAVRIAAWNGQEPFQTHVSVLPAFKTGPFADVDVQGLLTGSYEGMEEDWTALASQLAPIVTEPEEAAALNKQLGSASMSPMVTNAAGKAARNGLANGIWLLAGSGAVPAADAAANGNTGRTLNVAQLLSLPSYSESSPEHNVAVVVKGALAKTKHGQSTNPQSGTKLGVRTASARSAQAQQAALAQAERAEQAERAREEMLASTGVEVTTICLMAVAALVMGMAIVLESRKLSN